MFELAYLTACYRIGNRYHSGQWSKGYRLSSLAQERARRENSALDLGRQSEHLDSHSRVISKDFRKAVAFWVRKLKRFRRSL